MPNEAKCARCGGPTKTNDTWISSGIHRWNQDCIDHLKDINREYAVAIVGPDAEAPSCIWNLGWIRCLLTSYQGLRDEALELGYEEEDPSAVAEMLVTVKTACDQMDSALAHARGDKPATGDAAKGIIPSEAEVRLLNIARGCHDYSGGYRGEGDVEQAQAAAFHHGIETVVNALKAAIKHNPADLQVNALEAFGKQATGSEAEAADKEKQ